MATTNRKPHGIFCIEGDWHGNDEKPASVRPILELISHPDLGGVPFIHHSIGTRTEFEYHLDKWARKLGKKYPILYLGFHGLKGRICVGDENCDGGYMGLDELAQLLAGKCPGRIIHLASCETLGVNGHHLNRFLETTGALAVSGYKNSVWWLPSAAFELIMLSIMPCYHLDKNGARHIENKIYKEDPFLAKQLDFRMVY